MEKKDVTSILNLNKLRTSTLPFWKRYRKNRAAVFGLGLICFFVLIALLAPIIAKTGPFKIGTATFMPPSETHYMGTDNLGRDIFSQVVFGARISLMVGFLAASTSAVIGTLVGAISGFFGGKIDETLMRITEMFQIIPRFVLAIVIVALFGSSIWYVIFVIGILSWPSIARLVRAEFLSLKEQEFVEAARSVGVGKLAIIFREILPNASAPIIIALTLQVAGAIELEAGLSFLGLSDPNVMSWGRILHNAQSYLRNAWWMAFFPGLSIFFTALGANLVGDGLNDALNPRLKER